MFTRVARIVFGLALFVMLFHADCGGVNELGGNGSSSSVELVIKNPDSNASSATKAAGGIPNISTGKTLTRSCINSCTITVSGPGMDTVSKSLTVSCNSSSITTSLDVTPGAGRTFAVDCSDTTATTNNITIGYKGSTDADIVSGSNSVSLAPQYKNLISDASDGVQFMRLNQENTTQTKLTVGFGSVLTSEQKAKLRCVIELDGAGTRNVLGVIDTNRGDGLSAGTKSGSFILIAGGVSAPSGFLHDSNNAKTMRLNPAWETTDAGSTMITATFGITQMKSKVDSDQSGQFAGACSLTGTAPYDLIPDSGYGIYDLSPNTNVSDVVSLAGANETCSSGRSGETCSDGFCSASGVCASLSSLGSLSGNVTDFAGKTPRTDTFTGSCDASCGNTDGVGSAARFRFPIDLCISPDGSNVFVADGGSSSHTIRQISVSSASVTTLAGSAGSSGSDDGTGAAARFRNPRGCAVDPAGTILYVGDTGNKTIRKIVIASGVVTTFAGTAGVSGSTDAVGSQASFAYPAGLVTDKANENLYVGDSTNRIIRKIVMGTQEVTTFAGTVGVRGETDGIGTNATFSGMSQIAIDSTDTYLYVPTNKIRRILIATQEVSTFAGSGTASSVDGVGTGASFNAPVGVAIDPTDTYLYVSDTNGQKIRKVEIATQTVTTLAGSGSGGADSGIGSAASFQSPYGIVVDPLGTTLYVLDTGNSRIRKIQ